MVTIPSNAQVIRVQTSDFKEHNSRLTQDEKDKDRLSDMIQKSVEARADRSDSKKSASNTPPSSISHDMKEAQLSAIRERTSQLKIEAEALLSRVQFAFDDNAVAALARDLKRVVSELKRLVSQYKAIKSSPDISEINAVRAKPIDNNMGLSLNANISPTNKVQDVQTTESLNVVSAQAPSIETASIDRVSDESTEVTDAANNMNDEALAQYQNINNLKPNESSSEDLKESNEKKSSQPPSMNDANKEEDDGYKALVKEIQDKLKLVATFLEARARIIEDDKLREKTEKDVSKAMQDIREIDNIRYKLEQSDFHTTMTESNPTINAQVEAALQTISSISTGHHIDTAVADIDV